MGMDYVGENGTELHLNWAGFRFVSEIVATHYKLPKSFVGINEGIYLGPRSCGYIATGLLLAIERKDPRVLEPETLKWLTEKVIPFFEQLEVNKFGCHQW